MNLSESQMRLVEEGKLSLHEAREYVKARMGHANTEMTDRYLNYESNLDAVIALQENFEEYINNILDFSNKESL